MDFGNNEGIKKALKYVGIGIVLILAFNGVVSLYKTASKAFVLNQFQNNVEVRNEITKMVSDSLFEDIMKEVGKSDFQESEVNGSTEKMYEEYKKKKPVVKRPPTKEEIKKKLFEKKGIVYTDAI